MYSLSRRGDFGCDRYTDSPLTAESRGSGRKRPRPRSRKRRGGRTESGEEKRVQGIGGGGRIPRETREWGNAAQWADDFIRPVCSRTRERNELAKSVRRIEFKTLQLETRLELLSRNRVFKLLEFSAPKPRSVETRVSKCCFSCLKLFRKNISRGTTRPLTKILTSMNTESIIEEHF